jgi:hypothetical protein
MQGIQPQIPFHHRTFEGSVSAQKHLDWFNDFIDLEEVDFEDAKMRLFAQSVAGEVIAQFVGRTKA